MTCDRCSNEATILIGVQIVIAPGVTRTRDAQVCDDHAEIAVQALLDTINETRFAR